MAQKLPRWVQKLFNYREKDDMACTLPFEACHHFNPISTLQGNLMDRSYNFVSYQPMKVTVDRKLSIFYNSFITLRDLALLVYNLFYLG